MPSLSFFTLHKASMAMAIGVVFCAAFPSYGASFVAIGTLPGYDGASEANAISADGTTVVGESSTPNGFHAQAFRWTAATGMQGLGFYPGEYEDSHANGVSGDGSIVVGICSQEGFACTWTSIVGINKLSTNSASPYGQANAITPDGLTIVGSRDGQVMWWTGSTGMQAPTIDLPLLTSEATAVTSDGMFGVGNSSGFTGVNEAILWTRYGDPSLLGFLPGAIGSFGKGISADGSIVVGNSYTKNSWQEAFRWTAATGMVGLGDLPGGTFASSANAISADGSVIVGTGSTEKDSPYGRALRWDAAHGMQMLQAILEAHGVDLTDWTLTDANAISADGSAIAGAGLLGETYEAWVAYDIGALPSRQPVLRVFGKAKITTSDATYTLRGSAKAKEGRLRKVEVKVNHARYHKAASKANWHYVIALRHGENKIFVRASDTLGISSPVIEIVITRK